ncbi:hypothetical protein [Paenibacillus sp. UNC496MF]|uniref:hypothetical protein n=1 Tax=Paenibacillus sp. UNC496MF TaxID=1502753 RepID=UPI000B812223|nr:hypothetical protein [Paenibacillus sp. UNC496MF]
MDQFEHAYERMMQASIETASEERRRRIKAHDQAEKEFLAKVWWPAVGNLDDLPPAYELVDLTGGTRFADYAYLPPLSFRLIIEIDGFGPHWRDISRWKFADDLQRQNHLLIDGWHLLRFAFDDMKEKPRRCQQAVLLGLAKWGGKVRTEETVLSIMERGLLHLLIESRGELSPTEAAEKAGFNERTARKAFGTLEAKGIVHPIVSRSRRKMRYRLTIKPCAAERRNGVFGERAVRGTAPDLRPIFLRPP